MLLAACGSRGDLYQDVEPEKVQKTATEEAQVNIEESKKKQS
jgi:hypothetical protein